MKRVSPWLVVFVALLLIVQTAIVIKLTNDFVSETGGIHARASSGSVGLCINFAPIIVNNCLSAINQSTSIHDNKYYCQLYTNNTENETINYSFLPLIQQGLIFNVSPSGLVTIDANQSGVGLYVASITVTDGPLCPLSDTKNYLFEIVDINDPPFQRINMPSVALREGNQLSYGTLNNYFTDPDGDLLNFSYSAIQHFQVSIINSEIRFTNPSGNCENEYIYFTASDYEYSTDGNMIYLEAICDDPVPGGSGGGFGGCSPEWKCGRWSQCLPNGTRSRECIDLNGCDLNNLKMTFFEPCIYLESCFDGIRNQDETDVDCGGSCPACPSVPSCFDGIKNQGETGVDCGGPCEECRQILSCFDGIKNQGETGIDCGGPCEPCKEIQIPGLLETESSGLLVSMVIIFLIIVGLILIYYIFRKEIKSLYSKISWVITRKKKKQFLLDDDDKEVLLKRIRKLEDKFSMSKIDVFKFDDPLIQEILDINRLFFMKAFDVPKEFSKDEVVDKAEKILFHSTLKLIYSSFLDKQILLERKKISVSKLHFSFMIQEIKELVLGVSHYYRDDTFAADKNYDVVGSSMEKLVKLLHNAVVDLQFAETENAKEKYLHILGLYEKLTEKEKLIVYNDIGRLFSHIKYVISWSNIKKY